jgi:GAF domain-containing protein
MLADTLVADYDLADLLHTMVERCVELLDAHDAGIILIGESGKLEVVACTSQTSHLVELMELGVGEGPCVEAYSQRKVVSVDDVSEAAQRWPRFAAAAHELGYESAHAVPLHLREHSLGSLNLFREKPGELNRADAEVVRAMADVATIGILQERFIRESNATNDQLQRALTSRVIIEQAKGIIAEKHDVDMDEAFRRIRAEARNSGTRLAEVATRIVDGKADEPPVVAIV